MKNVEAAAKLINRSEQPFVLFGQGVILGNAELEFRDFIEKTGIPAAWTILGLGALPSDHPLNVGMLGMHGNYGPNVLTNECDVLIAIGMRFDDRVTGRLDKYAKQAKIIHLDIDAAEIDKNVKTDVAIVGDCKKTLPLLTALVEQRTHEQWFNRFNEFKKYEKENCKDSSMAIVIKALNELTDGEAIVVSDVGQHQMETCRHIRHKHSKSNITSGGLGTMGFALPAAIGAKLAKPDRTVVAIIGDGGFQMTLQELGTIMQNDIDIKIIILNNQYLGMVRQWQELFHEKRYSFVDIASPDYVKLANAYNIPGKMIDDSGQMIDDSEEMKEALSSMLNHEGAFLLEVRVDREDNVFPMVPQGCSVSEIRLK